MLTDKWILEHKSFFINKHIANGIGPNNSQGRLYRLIIKLITNKDKSFFYEASVVHDVLYWFGGNEKDRLIADYRFYMKMLKDLYDNLKFLNLFRSIFYFIVATIYFFLVRFKGKNHFNYDGKDAITVMKWVLENDK